MVDNKLIEAAVEVQKRAYVPYSNYPVGAALITAEGDIFAGCNVENSSYGLTICAERNACVQAVAAGQDQFTAIAVVGDQDNPTPPCGACRQFLYEFNPDLKVHLIGREEIISYSLWELLPEAFGPENLQGV